MNHIITENLKASRTLESHCKHKWTILIMVLLLTSYLCQSRADTMVCGTISGQTWTKAGSPYRVTCDIVVFSLTIEAGVLVLFEGDHVFEVQGRLLASGTAAEPIMFTRTNGGWQGVFFNHSLAGCELRYCVISRSINSGVRLAVENAPLLRDCVIEHNSAPAAGGGIQALSLAGNLTLECCMIRSNTVNQSLTRGNDRAGGGIYAAITGGSLTLRKCVIVGNRSNSRTIDECGVTMRGYGGGIYCENGDLTLSNCWVTNNTVWSSESGPCGNEHNYGYGGGIYFIGAQNRITLFNCIVAANTAYNGGSDPRGYGNGVYISSGTGQIENCTIARNGSTTDRNTDGLYNNAGSVGVTNSIIYWNSRLAAVPNTYGQQIVGTVLVTYSDVQGTSYPGVGNINVNPLLDSLHYIDSFSPCVDAGNPDPSYNDVCPSSFRTVRNDMGAGGGPGACTEDCERLEDPRITSQPQSQQGCLGQSATFCVRATGTPPFGYQWRYHGTNAANPPMNIAEATNSCLMLSNVNSNNAGYYSVRVSNPFGGVDSNPALLLVFPVCLSLDLYPGLSITGQVGRAYCIQYTTDLSTNTVWTSLTNVTLSTPEYFYLDPQPARHCDNTQAAPPRRFYRVNEGSCP